MKKSILILFLFLFSLLIGSFVFAAEKLDPPGKDYPTHGMSDVGIQGKPGELVTVEFQWGSVGDYAYELLVWLGNEVVEQKATDNTKYQLKLNPQTTYLWDVRTCYKDNPWNPFDKDDCDDHEFGGAYQFTTRGILPLEITTEKGWLPDGIVGRDYNDGGFQLKTNGGGLPPYKWGGTFNSLLKNGGYGLELLSESGKITGTPTKSVSRLAPIINVRDSKKGFDSGQFYIKIIDADLEITTEILPAGVEGINYPPFKLQVQGGSGTYIKWELIKGDLGGLQFKDGIISGTPSKAGDFLFDVAVTDSESNTAVKKDILIFIYKSDNPKAPPPETAPPQGSSGGITPIDLKGLNPLKAESVQELIGAISGFVWRLAVAIAPIMFIIAGFLFITSGGEPGRLRTAKNLLLYTVIGLAIVLLASSFIAILQQILSGEVTQPGEKLPQTFTSQSLGEFLKGEEDCIQDCVKGYFEEGDSRERAEFLLNYCKKNREFFCVIFSSPLTLSELDKFLEGEKDECVQKCVKKYFEEGDQKSYAEDLLNWCKDFREGFGESFKKEFCPTAVDRITEALRDLVTSSPKEEEVKEILKKESLNDEDLKKLNNFELSEDQLNQLIGEEKECVQNCLRNRTSEIKTADQFYVLKKSCAVHCPPPPTEFGIDIEADPSATIKQSQNLYIRVGAESPEKMKEIQLRNETLKPSVGPYTYTCPAEPDPYRCSNRFIVHDYPLDTLKPGSYSFRAKAIDQKNNERISDPLTIEILEVTDENLKIDEFKANLPDKTAEEGTTLTFTVKASTEKPRYLTKIKFYEKLAKLYGPTPEPYYWKNIFTFLSSTFTEEGYYDRLFKGKTELSKDCPPGQSCTVEFTIPQISAYTRVKGEYTYYAEAYDVNPTTGKAGGPKKSNEITIEVIEKF